MEQKPTIGRIVVYTTNQDDRDFFTKETTHWNTINQSYKLPAIIVAVWSDTTVNLQVIKDGVNGMMWKTSIQKGDEEGQWNFPVIIK